MGLTDLLKVVSFSETAPAVSQINTILRPGIVDGRGKNSQGKKVKKNGGASWGKSQAPMNGPPSPISSCLPLASLPSSPTQLFLHRTSTPVTPTSSWGLKHTGMLLPQDLCTSCSPYRKVLLSAITWLTTLTLGSTVTFSTRPTLIILFKIAPTGTPLPYSCFVFLFFITFITF